MPNEEAIEYCQRCGKRKDSDQKRICASCDVEIYELCQSMYAGVKSATALAAEFGVDLGALARRA